MHNRYLAIAAALALAQASPPAGADERPGYSHVELRADVSTTGKGARGARGDAEGRLAGFRASWEVDRSWYVRAGYSLEWKTFTNAVAGTVLSLRTKQTEISAGAGRSWSLASNKRHSSSGQLERGSAALFGQLQRAVLFRPLFGHLDLVRTAPAHAHHQVKLRCRLSGKTMCAPSRK